MRDAPRSNGESYFYVGTVAGQSMSGLLDGTWKQPYINSTNPSVDGVVDPVVEEAIEDAEEILGVKRTDDKAWELPLFPTRRGETASKAVMIEGWRKVTNKEVSGHSARR